jgi:hypothetical protein
MISEWTGRGNVRHVFPLSSVLMITPESPAAQPVRESTKRTHRSFAVTGEGRRVQCPCAKADTGASSIMSRKYLSGTANYKSERMIIFKITIRKYFMVSKETLGNFLLRKCLITEGES